MSSDDDETTPMGFHMLFDLGYFESGFRGLNTGRESPFHCLETFESQRLVGIDVFGFGGREVVGQIVCARVDATGTIRVVARLNRDVYEKQRITYANLIANPSRVFALRLHSHIAIDTPYPPERVHVTVERASLTMCRPRLTLGQGTGVVKASSSMTPAELLTMPTIYERKQQNEERKKHADEACEAAKREKECRERLDELDRERKRVAEELDQATAATAKRARYGVY